MHSIKMISEEGNDDKKKRLNIFQNNIKKDNVNEGEKLNENKESLNDIINKLFVNILNKINMGNDVKNELEEIKSNICIVLDENQQMKEKFVIMEYKMEQMNQQIQGLSKENDSIKEKLDELKEVLGEIQTRDLIRNFLKCFKTYLTQSERDDVRDGKMTTGKAISKRIVTIFPGVDQDKLYIVQNLLEASSDLLKEGNYFAHELFLENFDKNIEDYKKIIF